MQELRTLLMAVMTVLSLSACVIAPIDNVQAPPADWPQLQVSVQHTTRDLSEVCGLRGAVFWVGCAVADFVAGTCTVYLRYDDRAVLEHELMHCRGYDHPGERTFSAAWARYKAVSAKVRMDQAAVGDSSRAN